MSKHIPSRLESRIARDILELIRSEDLQPGHRLREQSLADRFGVSRTPVRTALHLLARSGALVFVPRRGFALARPAEEVVEAEATLTPSAGEALYERLAADHLSGALAQSFTETELVRRYGVSRTVVLAALARMAEEGLVERGKGRDWRFRPTLDTGASRAQSYAFRLIVEPASILLPTFRAQRAGLNRMRERHERLLRSRRPPRSQELFDLDADFHEMIARFSGNLFCLSAIHNQNQLRRLVEYSGYDDRRRIKAWIGEHLAVIEALSRNAREEAAGLLRRHLVKARRQPVRIGRLRRAQREARAAAAALTPPRRATGGRRPR
jgi:DNA-binding GntR family transcriptional regulator